MDEGEMLFNEGDAHVLLGDHLEQLRVEFGVFVLQFGGLALQQLEFLVDDRIAQFLLLLHHELVQQLARVPEDLLLVVVLLRLRVPTYF